MIGMQKQANKLTLRYTRFGNWLRINLLTLYIVADIIFRIVNIIWGGYETPPLFDVIFFAALILDIYSYIMYWSSETTINKELKTITIKRRGLFTDSFQTYPFDMVEGGAILFKSERNRYSVKLMLKDKTIDLTADELTKDNDFIDAVESINNMLGFRMGFSDYQLTLLDEG